MNKYIPAAVIPFSALPFPLNVGCVLPLLAYGKYKEDPHSLFYAVLCVWYVKSALLPAGMLHWIVYELISYATVFSAFIVAMKDDTTSNLRVLLAFLFLLPVDAYYVWLTPFRVIMYVLFDTFYDTHKTRVVSSMWTLTCVPHVMMLYATFVVVLKYWPTTTSEKLVQTVKTNTKPKQETPPLFYTFIDDNNTDWDFESQNIYD